MPDQERFSISEAARIVQVPAHVLRYWEARVGLPRPGRREGGRRLYSRGDMAVLLRLRELVRGSRLTLAGARAALLRELGRSRARARSGPAEAGAAEAGALGGPAARLLKEVRAELRAMLSEA